MNADIKMAAANAGVRLWQIAEELGIADTTFSKKLRREFSAEQKAEVFHIIKKLSLEVRK